MDEINLHFTGDFHAITSAHNLLAAMVDNHMYWGNALRLDQRRIAWRRVLDMNDRALREIIVGLGAGNGFPREDGFDITVASEVMAAFCLATGLEELEERLGRMVVGWARDRRPISALDLNAPGAMTALLKEALKPNLVQTLEGSPALVHGGPFANIAHGCNSVMATRAALKLADYVVTEAGFGADLGAEKFFDIKCRKAGLKPAAAVLVATVRALKMHGGVAKDALARRTFPRSKPASQTSLDISPICESLECRSSSRSIALTATPRPNWPLWRTGWRANSGSRLSSASTGHEAELARKISLGSSPLLQMRVRRSSDRCTATSSAYGTRR